MQETMEKLPINISVIIPSYNSECTILETIHSVQQQTYVGWEIVVVDDGSTDGTVSLVSDLAAKDSGLRIITQPNQGVCVARNTGLKSARYDWLLFLDSDDWIADHYFERVTSVLAAHPEIDAIHCGWVRVTPDGKFGKEMYGPPFQDMFPVLAMQSPFCVHACIVRKSLVEAAGGFDPSIKNCQDWDLWQRIARVGARFELVKEVLAFYRMRRNSLSSNGEQFFTDAIRVLTQAHFPDDRIKNVNLLHPYGEPAELLPRRKLYIATWFAGFLIGNGHEAKHLLTALASDQDSSLVPYWVAGSIFDAAIIPTCTTFSDWHLLYPRIESKLNDFLAALEVHCQTEGLAKRSKLYLEKLILQNTSIDKPIFLGSYYAIYIEITEPIKDIIIESKEIDRLYCLLKMEGVHLGSIELPVCDGVVTEYVLKDAIASQYHWSIIGRFFQNTIYSKTYFQTAGTSKSLDEVYDEIGWTTFMQQLWNRSTWDISKFYDAGIRESPAKKLNENNVKVIEISQELPDITTNKEKFNIVFSVGGINAGAISIPVKNKLVKASEIRAAININSSLELSRICAREALIGKQLNGSGSIFQRLREAANTKKEQMGFPQTNNALLLGRRMGQMSSSISRRAKLPAITAAHLTEMAKAVNESVVQQPENLNEVDQVLYVPELIVDTATETKWANKLEVQGKQANVFGRQHFETLFSKQVDPWKCTHPYEQTKYEFTLSLLPKAPINKALEIACAEGHFTEQLAPLVNNLIAADISQVALERAADRCKRFDHIQYKYLDLVKDNLEGQFDLIVCSEVLYFVGDLEKLNIVAKKIAGALLPNGHLVMAHAHQVIDEPDKPGYDWGLAFGAKVIGKTFANATSLQLVKEIQTPLYRVQLFQQAKPKLFSWLTIKKPSVQYLDQPTVVPERIIDTVRWNGGKPSSSTVISEVSTEKLPILMYHRVAPEGSKKMSRYCVTPAAFEEQLKYLKDSGYYSVRLQDWTNSIIMQRPLPGLAVVLTFDDACQDFYEYAWPLLQKYGFSATVFLVAEQVVKHNIWDEAHGDKQPHMVRKEIIELQQGIEFGSHSATNRPLTSLTPTEIVLEGARSRTDLQNALEKPIKLFAYPYGDTDTVVAHLIGACGYTSALTCENRLSTLGDDLMQLPRIEIEGSFSLKEFVEKLS